MSTKVPQATKGSVTTFTPNDVHLVAHSAIASYPMQLLFVNKLSSYFVGFVGVGVRGYEGSFIVRICKTTLCEPNVFGAAPLTNQSAMPFLSSPSS